MPSVLPSGLRGPSAIRLQMNCSPLRDSPGGSGPAPGAHQPPTSALLTCPTWMDGGMTECRNEMRRSRTTLLTLAVSEPLSTSLPVTSRGSVTAPARKAANAGIALAVVEGRKGSPRLQLGSVRSCRR